MSLKDKITNQVDNSIYQEAKNNRDGIYLLLSFDLANATEYKIRNQEWYITFNDFYYRISKELIKKENSPLQNLKIWKFIGDEVLFYLKVTKEEELFKSLPYIYKVIKDVEKELNQKSHFFDKLYIKTTAWIADVVDEQVKAIDTKDNSEKATNIIFSPPFENNNIQTMLKPDFLGFEIDLGFRISKYSHHGVIAVGAKLAYLLFKNRQILKDKHKLNGQTGNIDKNLKIVSYEKLKGIWRTHKYPIIWYSENWNSETMFFYDEHFDNELIETLKYKIKKNKLDNIEKLEKIFEDINQIDDIDAIIKKITESKPEQDNEVQLDKISEVHVALICFNSDKTKILTALRPSNKKRFPNIWEFGCGQIKFNETFEDTAKRTYKEDFGIDIEILNDSQPIAVYSFKASDTNNVIPGIILIGCTKKEEINQNKYQDIKWLLKNDIEQIDEKEYIKDFKKNALKAFSSIST